jgi:threonine dehydrogenase-like Zn-dependent dehydrogenase
MQALVWTGIGRVELQDRPEPEIADGHSVLVDVEASGVCCSSDVYIVEGRFGRNLGVTLGHETAGTIRKTGDEVERLAPGQRVVLDPTITCGVCAQCRSGHGNLCPNRTFIGLDADGGLAGRIVAPEANWVPVPDGLPAREACLAELLACALHAADEIGELPGPGILITHAGIMAYLFQQVFSVRYPEEKVMALGRNRAGLRLLRDAGAHTADQSGEDWKDAVREFFGGEGPALIVEQTGEPDTIAAAMDLIAPRGAFFAFDIIGDAVPFPFTAMALREARILTATGCAGCMPQALELMRDGRVDVARAISHEAAPEDMEEAFRMTAARDGEHVKTVILFD